jgi:hypothetical protein
MSLNGFCVYSTRACGGISPAGNRKPTYSWGVSSNNQERRKVKIGRRLLISFAVASTRISPCQLLSNSYTIARSNPVTILTSSAATWQASSMSAVAASRRDARCNAFCWVRYLCNSSTVSVIH